MTELIDGEVQTDDQQVDLADVEKMKQMTILRRVRTWCSEHILNVEEIAIEFRV